MNKNNLQLAAYVWCTAQGVELEEQQKNQTHARFDVNKFTSFSDTLFTGVVQRGALSLKEIDELLPRGKYFVLTKTLRCRIPIGQKPPHFWGFG